MTNPAPQNKSKKMKKVDGSFAKGWKPTGEGETLEGLYLGAQDVPGRRGKFKSFHIQTDDGEHWSVAGAALNAVFAQIPKRSRVTVTYTGMEETDKGDMRTFEVSVPEDVELLDAFAGDDTED